MKNNIKIFSLFCICFLLIGCGIKQSSNSTIKTENKFEIRLESNPTTGYTWSYKESEEGIVAISERYDNSNCPKDYVGCGGEEIYTLTPLKEGTMVLEFDYQRSFEDEPIYIATYYITVDENLNIMQYHDGNYFTKE